MEGPTGWRAERVPTQYAPQQGNRVACVRVRMPGGPSGPATVSIRGELPWHAGAMPLVRAHGVFYGGGEAVRHMGCSAWVRFFW